MLLVALKERFSKYLSDDPAHDTILWFDPERDYRELIEPLRQAGVPLRIVEHEGELIRVRSELQFRKPGARTVVYLPWRRDDPASDWLAPILPLADVFSDSLFRFLSGLGVEFPEEPRVRNAIRDVLPRLAGQSLGKGEGYWDRVLSSLDAVREELLGDFGDTLLRFLAFPNETRQELRHKEIEAFFFGLLSNRYGFEAEPHEEPPAIARRLTAHLVAVRAFVTSGKPDDFPFPKLLPAPHLFDACEAFLRRWQDSSYRVAFIRLADQIELRYRLDEWLSGLALDTALELGATFHGIESALWNRVESELTGLASDAAWLAFMQQHRQAFQQRADAFWAREDKAGQWGIARQAADLLSDVQACLDSLDAIPTAEALIELYAAPTGWWKVDRAYREFREAIGDATGSYDLLRQRCGRAYHRFLERLNGRFVELVSGRDRWAWKLPEQTAAWNELVKVQSGKRVAVIFVDALRLELAQALADRLRRDMDAGDITLHTRIVTLPAITPVCMPALLPDGHARKIDYTDDWQVTIGNSGNLASKPEREAYLRDKYPRVQIYGEISTLLELPADQMPASADLTITFHTALDKIGETAQELALTTFSEIIKQVERAIRKLREAEVQDIIVLTDHGFLLLDDVSEADKSPVKDVPALKSGSRYLVGRGLGYTDQLRFPVPGSSDLEGWYPRGIGCFRTPGKYNYAHGGLSLQEIVIPCLIVTQKTAGGVVAVEMSAPAEIRGKLLKVKLRPVALKVFDRERRVKLELVKSDQPVVAFDQVIEPVGETEVKVLLPDDAPLEIGDKVTWRLSDAVTSQVIAEQPAVNQVDFF